MLIHNSFQHKVKKNPYTLAIFEVSSKSLESINSDFSFYSFLQLENVTNYFSQELNELIYKTYVNQHGIKDNNISKQPIVMVILPSSNDRIITYLSCLKSYIVYCPIDIYQLDNKDFLNYIIPFFDIVIYNNEINICSSNILQQLINKGILGINISQYQSFFQKYKDLSVTPNDKQQDHLYTRQVFSKVDKELLPFKIWAHLIFTSGTSGGSPKVLLVQ